MQRDFIKENKEAKYERIKAAIKWLIGNGIAPNQAEIGKLIGYTNEAAFSKVINGKVSLPVEFTYKLCKLDKNRTLSETWVSEGWGPMIDKSRAFLSEEEKERLKRNEENLVEESKLRYNCLECKKKDEKIIEWEKRYFELQEKYFELQEELKNKKVS